MLRTAYPHADKFAQEVGIPAENLIRAFEIERKYRNWILRERDATIRKNIYSEVCAKVHPLYRVPRDSKAIIEEKRLIVNLFRRELTGRSILDIGCGTGAFLLCVAKRLKHKRLFGIDIDPDTLPYANKSVAFIQMDIVEFRLSESFDVAFSDNVLEHIAPADLPGHLTSVRNALNDGGRFIIIMPNRLFGPADVTRVIDWTCTNRIPAAGMHLFESTYSEMIPLLRRFGFNNFKTIIQVPKLTHRIPLPRIRPTIYLKIERNERWLNLMYKFRLRGKCWLKFVVVLICQKANPCSSIG